MEGDEVVEGSIGACTWLLRKCPETDFSSGKPVGVVLKSCDGCIEIIEGVGLRGKVVAYANELQAQALLWCDRDSSSVEVDKLSAVEAEYLKVSIFIVVK